MIANMKKTVNKSPAFCHPGRQRQRGVILFIALIALVALTMAGIGFMRSVDAGKLLSGNLAFSRASIAISDAGMEDARNLMANLDAAAMGNCGQPAPFSCLWMNAPDIIAATGFAIPTNGYLAWSQPTFDPQLADWANANLSQCTPPDCTPVQDTARTGYDVRYIVHRMCDLAYVPAGPTGRPREAGCLTTSNTGGKDQGEGGGVIGIDAGLPLYRVTIRVAGPRNTQSFIQVWMS